MKISTAPALLPFAPSIAPYLILQIPPPSMPFSRRLTPSSLPVFAARRAVPPQPRLPVNSTTCDANAPHSHTPAPALQLLQQQARTRAAVWPPSDRTASTAALTHPPATAYCIMKHAIVQEGPGGRHTPQVRRPSHPTVPQPSMHSRPGGTPSPRPPHTPRHVWHAVGVVAGLAARIARAHAVCASASMTRNVALSIDRLVMLMHVFTNVGLLSLPFN